MPEDTNQAQIPTAPVSLPNKESAVAAGVEDVLATGLVEATHQIPEGIPGVLEPVKQPSLDGVVEAEPLAQVHPASIASTEGKKVTYPQGITDINQARELRKNRKWSDSLAGAARVVLREETKAA